MCGVAGIVSLNSRPLPAASLVSMCDAIAHRGPDDAGYALFRPPIEGTAHTACRDFADPRFAADQQRPLVGDADWQVERSTGGFHLLLGHRRLSILDLSSDGHQPMATADQSIWLSYNGEIYNFPELRSELQSSGVTFRSRTDTEVILGLWEREGPACLERLDGMFSLAVYDRNENSVTLARDRFGVKPLYYAVYDNTFLFASEIKALFASGLIPAQIDPQGVVEYLTFQNLLGERTLFTGIHLLPPGHRLTFQPGRSVVAASVPYHSGFPHFDGHDSSPPQADDIACAFEQAIKKQLISDVPVGAYLSGGIDSGSIVAVANAQLGRMLTFTGGFDMTGVEGRESRFDERELARALANELDTEHREITLQARDMPACMERLTWHLDDPRVGMCHQNWYAAQLASGHVKVCLSGAGGDELFAGYPWRYQHGLTANTFAQFDEAYFRYWHRLLTPSQLPTLLSPDLKSFCTGARDAYDEVMNEAPPWQKHLSNGANLLQRALYFEFKTFLSGYLIVDDRISMAHSMETRVPFLDNTLVDMAFRTSPLQKLTVSNTRTTIGKAILREAVAPLLPAQIVHHPKQGFSPPDENWYRGPNQHYIRDVLTDTRTRQRGLINHSTIDQCLIDHSTGRRNHRLLLWSLMCLEYIHRHYIDSSGMMQRAA